MKKPDRIRRVALSTILLVGEGATEKAFLSYIKSLYINRGCGVSATIRNAHGKGPDHVANYAIAQCGNVAYDRVVVLLDTDLQMSPTVRRRAASKRIQVIGSTPCFEGLLLKILGEHVPAISKQCKERLGSKLPDRLTARDGYALKFPKEFLDERRNDVPELGTLLDFLRFD